MTSDITVNLSGSWSAKQRQNNGLDLIAAYVRRQWVQGRHLPRIPVVAYVEYHNWQEPLSGPQLTVSIPLIEPVLEADGTDPNGYGKQLMDLLDELRKQRGKGSVDDVPSRGGEVAGQEAFDFDPPREPEGGEGGNVEEPETRLTGDGPRVVPPASGEELLAERAEAKGKGKPARDPFVPPTGGDAA